MRNVLVYILFLPVVALLAVICSGQAEAGDAGSQNAQVNLADVLGADQAVLGEARKMGSVQMIGDSGVRQGRRNPRDPGFDRCFGYAKADCEDKKRPPRRPPRRDDRRNDRRDDRRDDRRGPRG
jgi:hypothetical protein